MGRSKNNKRKGDDNDKDNNHNRKKGSNKKMKHQQQREREWILDCVDSPKGETYDVELLVRRSVLEDDYGKTPKVDNNKETEQEAATTQSQPSNEAVPILSLDPISDVALDEESKKADDSSLGSEVVKQDLVSRSICIKKSNNAKRPIPKFYDNMKHYKPLPDGDCGDGILNPFPKEEVPDKYWSQRHRFFTRFDKGIRLDKESWYSVTPEAIANHIARHILGSRKKVVVLDPFCGCGGNAIAFATKSGVEQVVCIDLDMEKLKKAYHNASIYGVQHKLLLVHGNAFDVLSRYKDGNLIESESAKKHALPTSIDIVFLSPPWGGIDYGTVGKHGYDLACIKIDGSDGKVYDGEQLLQCAAKALGNRTIAYFLPKNINGVAFSVSALKAGYTTTIVMEQNILNGKLKTVTAYLGLGGE